jgi:hypothetical protein
MKSTIVKALHTSFAARQTYESWTEGLFFWTTIKPVTTQQAVPASSTKVRVLTTNIASHTSKKTIDNNEISQIRKRSQKHGTSGIITNGTSQSATESSSGATDMPRMPSLRRTGQGYRLMQRVLPRFRTDYSSVVERYELGGLGSIESSIHPWRDSIPALPLRSAR